MSKSDLDQLVQAGFKSCGIWQRSAKGEILFIHKNVPDQPGVYVFVVQKKIMYIGSAKRMRSRMRDYKRHQYKNSESRLVHREITKIHNNSAEIEVYILVTDTHRLPRWKGLPIDFLLGLEAGLILEFNPEWNRRGRKPVLET